MIFAQINGGCGGNCACQGNQEKQTQITSHKKENCQGDCEGCDCDGDC